MKFDKHRMRCMCASDAEWYFFWLDYKRLKKMIKQMAAVRQQEGRTAGAHLPADLLEEQVFFRQLHAEVKKCGDFFTQMEEQLAVRVERLEIGLNQIKDPELSRLSQVENLHNNLMQACVNFIRDAVLLEGFALCNYTAVSKVLKKHDKMLNMRTKHRFMRTIMAAQPFAMYPGVTALISKAEVIFKEIEQMRFLRTEGGMSTVLQDEMEALQAIMNLKQESVKLQEEELKADLATPPSPPRIPDESAALMATPPSFVPPHPETWGERGRPASQRRTPPPAAAAPDGCGCACFRCMSLETESQPDRKKRGRSGDGGGGGCAMPAVRVHRISEADGRAPLPHPCRPTFGGGGLPFGGAAVIPRATVVSPGGGAMTQACMQPPPVKTGQLSPSALGHHVLQPIDTQRAQDLGMGARHDAPAATGCGAQTLPGFSVSVLGYIMNQSLRGGPGPLGGR